MSTTTSDRIYYAWLAVFKCRLWRVWLHLLQKQELDDRISQANNISEKYKNKFNKKETKQIFFISSPTFLCIEMNADHLIYLTLLVADNQLPVEPFSVSAYCSVQQFHHRQEKISILHSIKTDTNSSFTNAKLKLPDHYKILNIFAIILENQQ